MSLALLTGILLAGCSDDSADGKTPVEKKRVEESWGQSGQVAHKAPAQKPARSVPASVPIGTGFDFYVLSLSWSPSWCGDNDPSGRSAQCAAGKAHGFVVHGLWPQNEQDYPGSCPTREPDRVPDSLGRSLFDIIPSMGLIGHEWRKHGVCSGLSQTDYFGVMRAARNRIVIPPILKTVPADIQTRAADIEASFLTANPGLLRNGMAVTCENGHLDEVRICMNKDLSFRPCQEVARDGCRAPSLTVPAMP